MDNLINKTCELTERQRQVFDFIEERIKAWGYPPTIREIGEHLGIRSTNGVADHLKALKRKGYLTQRGMKSRTLQPLRADEESPIRIVQPRDSFGHTIPILGRVAAGEPILAEEQAEGSVIVDRLLLGGEQEGIFALKVVGDSMVGDGIFDGDFIFVRKRNHAEPGSIVVVVIENEATVKRFYPEGERIRLQPSNPRLKPLYISNDDFRHVQIIGAVVGVYRKL